MKVVFDFQDVWDLVQNGIHPIGNRAIDEEKVVYKEKNKKDYKDVFIFFHFLKRQILFVDERGVTKTHTETPKALFIIYHCVNVDHFRKLVMQNIPKKHGICCRKRMVVLKRS